MASQPVTFFQLGHAPGAHLSTKEMGWLLFSIHYTVPKLGMQFYSKWDDWLQKVLFWFDRFISLICFSAGGASPVKTARADTE